MPARIALLSLLLLLCRCGTYSVLRPADNLPQGRVEIQAGAAISTIPELLPVLKADVGLTSWLEAGVQWEVYTALIGARLGILRSERHGIALAVGVQTGVADIFRIDLLNNRDWSDRFVIAPNLTIGRRFNDHFEIYIGGKALIDVAASAPTQVLTGKLGARWTVNEVAFLGAEGGVSFHQLLGAAYQAVGEGTGTIGVGF